MKPGDKKSDFKTTWDQASNNQRPVKVALLQGGTMIPGGMTETTLNVERIKGLKMKWVSGDGLEIFHAGGEGMIPAPNVKVIFFD